MVDDIRNTDLDVEINKLVLEPKRRIILPTEILKEILQKRKIVKAQCGKMQLSSKKYFVKSTL